MIRLSLFTIAMFIGLSMVIAKNQVKFRNNYQKRLYQNNEQIRSLRNLMGKLIDTEANAIYAIDGQKEQNSPLNSDATTKMVPFAPIPPPKQGEMACLAACHSCLEGYSIVGLKKKNDDNCGLMCDCADSCFFIPAEQVGDMYGQISSAHKGKDCWWRTYNEILNNAK